MKGQLVTMKYLCGFTIQCIVYIMYVNIISCITDPLKYDIVIKILIKQVMQILMVKK